MEKVQQFSIYQQPLLRIIFDFMSFKELMQVMFLVSKQFKAAASDENYLSFRCYKEISISLNSPLETLKILPSDKLKNLCKEIISSSHQPKSLLPIAPFYTDGGAYSPFYFIPNIRFHSNLYCTNKGNNTHVACVCSDAFAKHIEKLTINTLDEYEVQPEDPNNKFKCYKIKYEKFLEKRDDQLFSFGIIRELSLKRCYGYSCFLDSFAIFVSWNPISTMNSLVRLLDGINTTEKLEALNIAPIINKQRYEKSKFIELDLNKANENGVYMLLYGQIDTSMQEIKNIAVKQKIGFKYMLIKLIDSHKTGGDTNIDCYKMDFYGQYLTMNADQQ